MRVMSRLPVALMMAQPHPDPNRPGDSPALKQGVLSPGVSEVDGDLFKAWTAEGAPGANWLATADQVKAGDTDGRIYAMTKDEAEAEYGFEIALKRAVDAIATNAGEGSTVKDPAPVPAEAMRTGTTDPVAAPPVLSAAAPLKVPATGEAPAVAPVAKVQPAAASAASK